MTMDPWLLRLMLVTMQHRRRWKGRGLMWKVRKNGPGEHHVTMRFTNSAGESCAVSMNEPARNLTMAISGLEEVLLNWTNPPRDEDIEALTSWKD